mgnify:CR=1 FL=1
MSESAEGEEGIVLTALTVENTNYYFQKRECNGRFGKYILVVIKRKPTILVLVIMTYILLGCD